MIQKNLAGILQQIPDFVKLVVVTKMHSPEEMMEVYRAGHKVMGENKPQELLAKIDAMPQDVEWHFIGHLQTNKVKYIAPHVHLIHAVDSLKLLKTINKEALKNERTIQCLLQFHIAKEDTKFGLDRKIATTLLNSDEFQSFHNIEIVGVMGMATFTENTQQVRAEFQELKEHFNFLKETYFKNQDSFREISMGMSNDFNIAIEEGATIVRIGSAVFQEN